MFGKQRHVLRGWLHPLCVQRRGHKQAHVHPHAPRLPQPQWKSFIGSSPPSFPRQTQPWLHQNELGMAAHPVTWGGRAARCLTERPRDQEVRSSPVNHRPAGGDPTLSQCPYAFIHQGARAHAPGKNGRYLS